MAAELLGRHFILRVGKKIRHTADQKPVFHERGPIVQTFMVPGNKLIHLEMGNGHQLLLRPLPGGYFFSLIEPQSNDH